MTSHCKLAFLLWSGVAHTHAAGSSGRRAAAGGGPAARRSLSLEEQRLDRILRGRNAQLCRQHGAQAPQLSRSSRTEKTHSISSPRPFTTTIPHVEGNC
ncbi:hypothetical protein T484DRAFT_1927411 [Baffinella frigidus]|nr:hypothetical protein T484DRAFT_1927411 [Cryptophyta sp. CCMP2293]